MNEEEARERLAAMLRAELCRVRPVWVGDFGPHKIADALLPTVRALIAEAREEGRREARPPQPHNHTRFSNNGGPWSPCPRTCPAALDPQ